MNLDVSSHDSHRHSHESPTLRSSLRQSRREEFQSYRAGEDEIRQTNGPSMKNRFIEALTTYRTYYELRVRNRYLGYMAVSIVTLIFLYFIVYVFLVGHLYLEKEKSVGSSFLKLTGRPYADDENMRQIWLLGDQLKSTAKSGIITLPTRVRITKGQKTGECGTPLVPCKTMQDCSPKNFPNLILKQKCVTLSGTRKGCNAIQWCPAEDIENSAVTKIIDLTGVEQQTIGIKSQISFSSKPDLAFAAPFNTIDIEYPRDNANIFSVDSLLVLAGTNYQNVKYIGCILQVNVYWKCDLDDDECGTYYEVKRLDNEMGYAQKHTEYYKNGLETTRDEYHYSGIKVIVNVVGVGERVSIPYLVMYFFSTIVLLYVVRILTDLFLVYFATEKRHYSELKFEYVTPDNSY